MQTLNQVKLFSQMIALKSHQPEVITVFNIQNANNKEESVALNLLTILTENNTSIAKHIRITDARISKSFHALMTQT